MADPISPLLRGHLERASFEVGGRLTAADLNLEHQDRVQLLRHHLRFLHGWGVVCGLYVVALEDAQRPWLIRVCPGYGVNPCGDEIVMPRSLDFDLSVIEWQRQLAGAAGVRQNVAYIGLRLTETPSRPVHVEGCGCGCCCECSEDMRPSRMRDTVEVVVVWKLLEDASPAFDFCNDLPPCVTCPPTCDLVLASVALPNSTSETIKSGDIDNSIRRIL